MREQKLEKYLNERIKKIGGKSYKWVSPGVSGVPDRLVCFPGGRVIFVELKAPGKVPTARQKFVHRELMNLGCLVYVIDSRQQVDDLIQKWGEQREI